MSETPKLCVDCRWCAENHNPHFSCPWACFYSAKLSVVTGKVWATVPLSCHDERGEHGHCKITGEHWKAKADSSQHRDGVARCADCGVTFMKRDMEVRILGGDEKLLLCPGCARPYFKVDAAAEQTEKRNCKTCAIRVALGGRECAHHRIESFDIFKGCKHWADTMEPGGAYNCEAVDL